MEYASFFNINLLTPNLIDFKTNYFEVTPKFL